MRRSRGGNSEAQHSLRGCPAEEGVCPKVTWSSRPTGTGWPMGAGGEPCTPVRGRGRGWRGPVQHAGGPFVGRSP